MRNLFLVFFAKVCVVRVKNYTIKVLLGRSGTGMKTLFILHNFEEFVQFANRPAFCSDYQPFI
jgi:hypothetical protein